MKNIKSFEIDHNNMKQGFYNLGENKGVITYDMRFKLPNKGEYISNGAIHSIEHLFAVVVRNSDIKDNVIYFGPMGCRTGFYLLLYNIHTNDAIHYVIQGLQKCLEFDKVPGTEEIQCGNYKEHNLQEAQQEIRAYLNILLDIVSQD